MDFQKNHWIIRTNDGVNFKNSNYPVWGVVRGKNNQIKTTVSKIKEGDILWFITSKKHGGKIIGMAEYICFYDRKEEPLISIKTYTNEEQNWTGNGEWDIQLHYKNLYETERQDIKISISSQSPILNYKTFKNTGIPDLENHYKGFKFYATPKIFYKFALDF